MIYVWIVVYPSETEDDGITVKVFDNEDAAQKCCEHYGVKFLKREVNTRFRSVRRK